MDQYLISGDLSQIIFKYWVNKDEANRLLDYHFNVSKANKMKFFNEEKDEIRNFSFAKSVGWDSERFFLLYYFPYASNPNKTYQLFDEYYFDDETSKVKQEGCEEAIMDLKWTLNLYI
jgi:hypothetical protein